jgi:hypothetical protein
MSRRVHLTLSDQQHDFLVRASERTSLSVAELVRRAIDEKYPGSAAAPNGREFTLALWRRPAVPNSGRRSGIRLD